MTTKVTEARVYPMSGGLKDIDRKNAIDQSDWIKRVRSEEFTSFSAFMDVLALHGMIVDDLGLLQTEVIARTDESKLEIEVDIVGALALAIGSLVLLIGSASEVKEFFNKRAESKS